MSVITFQDAIGRSTNESKRYLLLGNGFSTALFRDIFSYNSIREEADFSSHTELASIFDQIGTSDFEKVIRAMENAATIAAAYSADQEFVDKIKKDSAKLKQILVQTISARHPETTNQVTEAQKASCSRFLSNFKKIYTLNYDVLLYWVLLHGRESRPDDIDDGFRLGDEELGVDYRVFDSPHSPTFFFLHGALHLYDSGSQTRKYVWADSGRPLITQVQDAISQNLYPLFVAEGSSDQKLTRINHNGYLSKALRSFESICDMKDADLFIFGHSLNDSDNHILNFIKKGKFKRVFVSIYKGNESDYPADFVSKAQTLKIGRAARSPLEIILFDAQSANVWGGN